MLAYAYGPVGQLAPPVLAALFWKRATGPAALTGLVLGSAFTLGLPKVLAHYGADALPVHPGLPGLALNVVTIAAVSVAFPKKRG